MCPVGGAAVAKRVSEIMGVKTEEKEPMTARVMCSGSHGTAVPKFEYDGAVGVTRQQVWAAAKSFAPMPVWGLGHAPRSVSLVPYPSKTGLPLPMRKNVRVAECAPRNVPSI